MKRFQKLLALALALVLLALPTAALAEPAEGVEVYRLVIGNPQIYMNGAMMGDLSGLEIEGSVYELDEAGVLRLRLLGDGSPAADVYASFDGRSLLLGADGISNIYSVPVEKLPFYSDMMAQMMLMTALFSEETLDAATGVVMDALMSFIAKVEASTIDEGTRLIDHATGPVDMQGTTFVIRAEDLQALFDGIEEGLEAIPAIAQLMTSTEVAADSVGYSLEKGAEGADLFDMLGDMSITTWMSEDESLMRLEMRMSVTDPEGKEAPAEVYVVGDIYEDANGRIVEELYGTGTQDGVIVFEQTGVAYITETDTGMAFEYDIAQNALVDDEMQLVSTANMYLYPAGYTADNPESTVFGMTMDTAEYDDVDAASFNISGYYAPADGVEHTYDEFSIALYGGSADDNFTFDLLSQNQHADGEEYYGLQISAGEDDEIYSLYYTFEGTYDENAFGGDDHSGALRIGAGDGAFSFEFAADIEVTHSTASAADLPSFDGTPINALSLGEKEMDQLNQEGEALLAELINTLSAASPGLGALLSSGML